MKTLTEQFKDILTPFYGRLTKQEIGDIQKALWIAVKKRDAYVIGENEEELGLDREEDFANNWINGEKAEQCKRAEETL